MSFPKIAIIGAGNMGQSLIGGLIKESHPPTHLWATDTSAEKLHEVTTRYGIHGTPDNTLAIAQADVVIFAIKPQMFAQVLPSLATIIHHKKPLLISIAAGVPTQLFRATFGRDIAIIRAMPNTPALLGCGATALYASAEVTEKDRAIATAILRAVGSVVWVQDEASMNTVTALSGSGPAYFFLVMEALEAAAEKCGLDKATAHTLTVQTALGAARMAFESNKSLAELRQQVTSPGGTTEKALNILEEKNVRDIFAEAIQAAKHRSEELAKL